MYNLPLWPCHVTGLALGLPRQAGQGRVGWYVCDAGRLVQCKQASAKNDANIMGVDKQGRFSALKPSPSPSYRTVSTEETGSCKPCPAPQQQCAPALLLSRPRPKHAQLSMSLQLFYGIPFA
jgi:hypothetical protein